MASDPPGSFAEAERFAWRLGLSMTPAERLQWLEDTLSWALEMQRLARERRARARLEKARAG